MHYCLLSLTLVIDFFINKNRNMAESFILQKFLLVYIVPFSERIKTGVVLLNLETLDWS